MQSVITKGTDQFVQLPGADARLITMAGQPAVLSAGWRSIGVTDTLGPNVLLNLVHPQNGEATWFLDADYAFQSGSLKQLPEPAIAALRERAGAARTTLAAAFFTNPDFAANPVGGELFEPCEATRRAMFDTPEAAGLPKMRVLDAATLLAEGIRTRAGTVPLDRGHLAMATGIDPEILYLEACRSCRMGWPSPVDGRMAEEVRGFVLNHITMAWRCVDRRNGVVFFVTTHGFRNPKITLFLAETFLAGIPDGQPDAVAEREAGAIFDHVMTFGRELLPFLCRPIGRMAHYMWGEGAVHVGHHHWNELPGLETIVRRLAPEDRPLIYDIAGAAGDNFYDQLANLFPELGARVDLSSTTAAAMLRHAYARGIQVLRFGGSRISAFLRDRISSAIALTPAFEEASRHRAESSGPVVVFGLRVENRTFTDPVGFYVALARTLLQRFGSLTIVIDGHNGKSGQSGQTFASYMEQRATIRPMEIEQQIVADLRDALRKERVKIVNCVGMSLRENLAWMSQADYCVAPWGAGLAKYRWALNLPTYVLLSNHCRNAKGDIKIYNGEPDMEAPSDIVFVSEPLVTDRPDLPVLVAMDAIYVPYYVNYDLAVDGTIEEITAKIAAIRDASLG